MDIAGRTALITGAGRGLGAALAEELAAAGANVIVTGRDVAALERVAGKITARCGRRPAVVRIDLAGAVPHDLAARFPSIDILVNNGAKWLTGALEDNTSDEITDTIASQLTGTILLTRSLLPLLKSKPHADIVNVVSISGLANTPLQGASAVFHAAKHGQAGFSDGLRQECSGSSVRVSAIHPPNLEDIQPGEPAWSESASRPKSSRCTNRDIADAILFMLTRDAHCTIANMMVDGGAGGLF